MFAGIHQSNKVHVFRHNLFKLVIILFSLFLFLQADAAERCKKYHTKMPCEEGQWEFAGYALFYQNTSNYLTMERGPGGQHYNFNYDWGLELAGARYLQQGMDFIFQWLHYKNTSTLIDNNGVIFSSAIPGQSFNQLNRFDILNFELSQNMHFGEYWRLRMHAGLQYALLHADIITVSPGSIDSIKNNIIGPRIGMHFKYVMLKNMLLHTNIAILGFYDNASIYSDGASAISRTRASNVNYIEQSLGIGGNFTIGTEYHKQLSDGLLITDVAWDNLIYMLERNRVGWSGLKFGMKWKGEI